MKLVRVHFQLSSGFIWLTHVMERAKAHFQMKTILRDAWSEDIHYKVMQRSKNRNRTGYLRQHTHTHTSQATWHKQRYTHWWWHMIQPLVVCVSLEFCASQIRHKWKRTFVLAQYRRFTLKSITLVTHEHTMHCVSRGGCYLVNSYCDLQEDNQYKKESYQACWLSLVLETRPQYK